MSRGLWLVILLCSGAAMAATRLEGPLPLPLTGNQTPQRLDLSGHSWPAGSDDELVIEGDNPSTRPQTLILRIDDEASVNYRSRVNLERIVAPGPFTQRFSLSEWRTTQPRALALEKLTKLYLFMADNAPPLTIHRWYWEPGLTLPEGTIALDLGAAAAPRFTGFEALSPGDPRLIGHPTPILRPSGDALVRDGLRNLDGVRLDLAKGRYQLTLWLDDPGEWEYLPHPFERSVLVNGEPIWAEQWQPQDWLTQRYLAGQSREALPNPDPWQLFGAHQGGPVHVTLNHPGGPLTITLVGHSPDAKYLAGLLLAPYPADTGKAATPSGDKSHGMHAEADARRLADATARVLTKQRQLFLEKWTLTPYSPAPASQQLSLTPIADAAPTLQIAPASAADALQQASQPVLAARGSQLLLEFAIHAATDDPAPLLVIQPPEQAGSPLALTPYYGQWHLVRPQASGTLLTPSDQELVEGIAGLTLLAGVPRRLVLQVTIPRDAPAGRYLGNIQLLSQQQLVQLPLTIEVLPLTLPAASKPVGIYVEAPPYLNWLSPNPEALKQQIATASRCDLQRLAKLGISGLSPALPQDEAGMREIMGEAAGLGFVPPLLAYTPLKRWGDDPANQLDQWQARQQALTASGLPPLAWSLFDEPDLATLPAITTLAREMKRRDPAVIRAGHFNHPGQVGLLAEVEIALINAGFGADKTDVARVRQHKVTPWFYNLGTPRAAGFYLWQSGAEGYLQWHGRMPTALPYDPTDGRESDFMLLGPQACEAHRLSHDLLLLQQAIEDLRWLAWLEQEARYQVEAALLLERLHEQLPTRWQVAEQLPSAAWIQWRREIEQLAKRLKTLQTGANSSS
ncbi:hypothetical protein [Aeromonas allosaccharophila]|uniref:hypothetical protein n=1 Tax=Aeromonas allosaccharophila TaxID=656 RepID=UPI001116A79C|nr:hypothetical protein [Aeromonas allosaccharophila]TNI95854.1 hypothetical protein CF120_00130 [Aeromonas allosaccharophila]